MKLLLFCWERESSYSGHATHCNPDHKISRNKRVKTVMARYCSAKQARFKISNKQNSLHMKKIRGGTLCKQRIYDIVVAKCSTTLSGRSECIWNVLSIVILFVQSLLIQHFVISLSSYCHHIVIVILLYCYQTVFIVIVIVLNHIFNRIVNCLPFVC